MNLTVSPNRYVPWYQALELLGFDVDATVLPAKTVCPLCRSVALYIYEDNRFGGYWHYCDRCKHAGDMITLAAKFWKTTHYQALHRLAAELPIPPEFLTDNAITAYLHDHIDRHRLVQAFLSTIDENQTIDGAPGLDLLRIFNLEDSWGTSMWPQRMGKYLKLASARQIRDLLPPTFRPRSRSMKSALVIPFYNLPGRLSGLLMYWREREKYRSFFCSVLSATTVVADGSLRYTDPGLAMYDTMLTNGCADLFGRRVFALPFMEALRLQSKHLRDSTTPLPIVGVYYGVNELTGNRFRRCHAYDVWETQKHRHFVFWAPQITAEEFNMAARCDGSVVLLHEDKLHAMPIMRQRLYKLQQAATTWSAALDKFISHAAIRKRTRLIQELDISAVKFDEFRQSCSEKTHGILSAGVGEGARHWISFGNKRIISNANGWIIEPGAQLICSARLVIEKTLVKQETQELYYQGRIYHQNEEVKFIELAEVVDCQTFEWMQRTLISGGARPMRYDTKWSKHAVSIAMQMHAPVAVKNAGRYGWNYERGAFILPRFIIRIGGKVESESDALDDPVCPGLSLPNPMSTAFRPEPLLTPTLESELFWATVACIGANVIAPALNMEPAGTGFVGMGAAWAGRITAQAAGCATHQVDTTHVTAIASRLTKAINMHNWPLLVEFPRRSGRSYLAAWLNDADVKNVVMEMDRNLFSALKIYSHWRFVKCDTPITDVERISTYGAGILPAWLVDICRRRLQLHAQGKALASIVLKDMACWLEELGLNVETIGNASKWLEDTDDSVTDIARHFTQTLCRLVDDGVLPITKAGFEDSKKPGCTYHEEGDALGCGLFVPRALINKALLTEGSPLIEPTTVTSALAEAGVLEQETNYQGYQGWLINTDWWQQQFKIYRKTKARILRVVG